MKKQHLTIEELYRKIGLSEDKRQYYVELHEKMKKDKENYFEENSYNNSVPIKEGTNSTELESDFR